MDNPVYITLSRQSGLLKQLNTIANNIANASTTGFKKEGALFTEYVAGAGQDVESLSIGRLGAQFTSLTQGTLSATGGNLDVAIEGDGFFLVGTEEGERLTRAGRFQTDLTGRLVNPDGLPVLDEAGGEIQLPPEASSIVIASDGTISADGNPLGKLGVVSAAEETLERLGNNLWTAKDGYEPVLLPRVVQGFLEDSNVNPVEEIARLIEVQRSYEAGQKIFEQEDDRVDNLIRIIRQQ